MFYKKIIFTEVAYSSRALLPYIISGPYIKWH